MKVYKVADIVDGEILLSGRGRTKVKQIVSILTNLDAPLDPNADLNWSIPIEHGEGTDARLLYVQIPPLIAKSESLDAPKFVGCRNLVYFRDRLFLPERAPRNRRECEVVILRVKKAVYAEDAELTSLRSAVANLEAAIEYSKSGQKRETIPDDVKLVVWARDGGACIRCESKENLQFDHVIPVAKGGGNTAANLQILCQPCNLKKGAKISID